jgi:hypothetical protein
LTFEGVESHEMNDPEMDILEKRVIRFLDDILAQFDPPIDILDVEFDSQSLQLDVIAVEQQRYLQAVAQGINATVSTIPTINVNITITGEYLPPPEVDFTMVVVETFDDEGEEFAEVIDEISDEEKVTYFKNVTSTKAKTVVVLEEKRASGATSSFGGLGKEAGLSLIGLAASLVFIVVGYQTFKTTRKWKSRSTYQNQLRARSLFSASSIRDKHFGQSETSLFNSPFSGSSSSYDEEDSDTSGL